MWIRSQGSNQSEIDYDDWLLIETLLQDLIVIDRNLGSETRVSEAMNRIRTNCENEEVIRKLSLLAKRM